MSTDNGPKEMSSTWFSQIKLTPAIRKRLCFAESLLIVEECGTVVGKTYCSVKESLWGKTKCLCIYAESSGKFPSGLEAGTSITSFVDYDKLTPLQELDREWATLHDQVIERKTLLISNGLRMPCTIKMFHNGKLVEKKSFNVGVREREVLVTEATNILLHRLLIHDRRTLGSMLLQSISFTGKVVRAKYVSVYHFLVESIFVIRVYANYWQNPVLWIILSE